MIFSRRTIQRMLDENTAWMTRKQVQKQVRALNNPEEPSPLAWVWEVAVLNGLSKLVKIVHEPDLGSKPDIVFEVDGETVIADVTTISDKSRHEQNPIEQLNDEFMKRLRPFIEAGLKGGFGLSIRERNPRIRGRDQDAPKLHIPSVDRFDEVVFTSAFDEFLASLERLPNVPHSYPVNNAECNLTFTFSPDGSGWTLNSMKYTQATVLTRNTLWNALADKWESLARVRLAGHRGIIVCDGDCETIKSKGDSDQYGADQIIARFLLDHDSIEFVLTLAPKHNGSGLNLNPKKHSVFAKLHHREREVSPWLTPIRDFPFRLPQVRNTGLNARYEVEWKRANMKWDLSASFRGASTVSRTRIKFSARDLLEVLAGVLRQKEFEALPFMADRNPFLNKLKNGQLITAVRIEKDETEADDDWAVIEFSDPDPAISRFRVNTNR